jgi:hypothetical protein
MEVRRSEGGQMAQSTIDRDEGFGNALNESVSSE